MASQRGVVMRIREEIGWCARETLKPNLSGNSAKRRWRRVLLPTPDGPEMTRGRPKSVLAVVDIVDCKERDERRTLEDDTKDDECREEEERTPTEPFESTERTNMQSPVKNKLRLLFHIWVVAL